MRRGEVRASVLVLVLLIAVVAGCGANKEVGTSGLDVDSGDGDADADADADADGDGDADADADSDGDGDGDTDADTDADADVDSDSDSDTDVDTDSDADGDVTRENGGETCSDAVGIQLGAAIEGDTTGAANDYEDDCVTSDGPEVAYAFEPPDHGVLTVDLEAVPGAEDARWDTVLYLRTDCGAGDLACNDDWDVDDDGEVNVGWSHLERCVQPGYDYRLVVDGFSPDHFGAFVLSTSFVPCDDGAVCIDGWCQVPE